jgi:hypothetical protein
MIFLCGQREKGSQVGIRTSFAHMILNIEFSGPYNDLSISVSVFYQMIFLARPKRSKNLPKLKRTKMKLQVLYPKPLCIRLACSFPPP